MERVKELPSEGVLLPVSVTHGPDKPSEPKGPVCRHLTKGGGKYRENSEIHWKLEDQREAVTPLYGLAAE